MAKFKIKKKIPSTLPITILVLLVSFLVFGFCQARELELTYPNIPGAIRPVSTRALLPETLIYLFSLAIRIAGLIVFGSLTYGGVLYLTSAGDPNRHKDAQDQMLNSFIGLGLILFSFLLLNTINPQLIKLGIAKEMTTQGIILFKTMTACNEFRNDATKYDKLAQDNQALKITSSISNLRGFLGEEYSDSIQAVYSFEKQEDLEIQTFNEENWVEGPVIQSVGENDCVLGFSFASAKSIKLVPKPPGVYLCCGGTYDGNWTCQGEEKYLSASTAALPPECHDKVQGIKLKFLQEFLVKYFPGMSEGVLNAYETRCREKGGGDIIIDLNGNVYCAYKFAAVLHNNANYKAECEVFLESVADLSTAAVIKNNKASSATVFRPIQEGFAEGAGVILHSMRQHNDPAEGPGPWPDPDDRPWKKIESADTSALGIADPSKVNSLEMAPAKRYIAILFEGLNYTERCEVFEKSDEDFVNNDIGKTGCEQFWEGGCNPSVKSLKIYPTR